MTGRARFCGRGPYAGGPGRSTAHPSRVFLAVAVLTLLAACRAADPPGASPDEERAEAPAAETPQAAAEPAPDSDAEPTATASPADGEGGAEEQAPATVATPRSDSGGFQAGVAVLIYGNEEPEQFEDKTRRVLDTLVALSANSVSVVFPVHQEHWQAVEVYADEERTPSTGRLRFFARAAHERGFTVMLRPILDEQSLVPDGQWRGSIRPPDLDAWFASYGDLVAGYAELASEEGVELLAVGSELTSLQGETARWQELVERVRGAYDGELVYAANWDAPAPDLSGALEWHGIDAFYPLEAPDDAPVEELAAAWDPWLAQLADAGVALERVVFTEIGVRAQRGAHRRPYVWEHGSPVDVEAQERYYEAACRRLAPEIAGLYWWMVDFDYPEEAAEATSFSPLGKPAADAVARCFRDLGD